MMREFTNLKVEYEVLRSKLAKHQTSAIASMKLTYASAFALAKAFAELRDSHYNDFIAELKARFPRCTDPFDRAVAEDFAPLTAMGGDPYGLFKFVSDGGTKADYVASAPFVTGGRKRQRESHVARTDIPVPTDESLSESELLKIWRARAESLELDNRNLRRQLAEQSRKSALLEKQVDRIQRVFKAMPVSAA